MLDSKFLEASEILSQHKGQPGTARQILAARKRHAKLCQELDVALTKTHLMHGCGTTGSGKTIALTQFAARTAMAYGITRIIYVTPFILITDQAEAVLQEKLRGTCLEVVASHSRKKHPNKHAKKHAQTLPFDITVCTTQKLHLALLRNKEQKAALNSFKKSVIIIDDASQYLRPEIASAVLVLLDQLRKGGARIILASATLPHYETIADYLPKSIKIHRFGSEIAEMPGIKDRCEIIPISRPVGIPQLIKIVRNASRPFFVVCETVAKSIVVFGKFKAAFPKTSIFLVNSRQSQFRRRADIARIEKALKAKERIIVVSTSSTHAGWDVSFADGFNDVFDTVSAHEQGGRINRGFEFPVHGRLYVGSLVIPNIAGNSFVQATKNIAMDLIDEGVFTSPGAPTIAAKRLLEASGSKTGDKAAKAASAAKKANYQYLRDHVHNIVSVKKNSKRRFLPPAETIPVLYEEFRALLTKMGLRFQLFEGDTNRIFDIKDAITVDQIKDLLAKSKEIISQHAFEIKNTDYEALLGKGEVLRRIVFRIAGGTVHDTGYFFLAPAAFNANTGLLKG